MLWAVGAVVAVGVVAHSDHSNHSNYSDHSQYSDSDMVMKIKSKSSQLEQMQHNLNSVKGNLQREIQEQKEILANELNLSGSENLSSEDFERSIENLLEEKYKKKIRTEKKRLKDIDVLIRKINEVQLQDKQ